MDFKPEYIKIKRAIGTEYFINYGIIPTSKDSWDLIDFFKINTDQYGVYLADIAGSGKACAKVMRNLQKLIFENCLAKQPDPQAEEPAKILAKINTAMYNNRSGKYLTLIYGVVDLAANTFNYATAGFYPNPILIDPQHKPEYVLSTGYPLGVLPEVKFQQFRVNLAINSTLILFSDGIMNFFLPTAADHLSKSEKLLNLLHEQVTEFDLEHILSKLHLTKRLPLIDDLIILTIRRNRVALPGKM